MKTPSIAEFAQLRFVKDGDGNFVYLPAKGIDERVILALDCNTYRLVRLHIFEGGALRSDKLEAFEEEMQQIADLKLPGVSRILSWGRDEDELFFADEMLDGEPLPDYLQRTGGVSFSIAAEWVLHLADVLESCKALPPTLERFSNLNIQVTVDRFGKISPGFSEFYAWTKPGIQKADHCREWMLAQVFCSAIVGVPSRIFSRGSLPRNFDELPGSVQDAVLNSLDDKKESSAYEDLKREMRQFLQSESAGDSSPPRPVSAIREWMAGELAASYQRDAKYSLGGEINAEETRYACEAILKGRKGLVQIVPGKESIPRLGWFNQHHDATRRPGRGIMHQLTVQMIEDRGAVSLIGEEWPEGIDLESLVHHTGPLEIPDALGLARRVAEMIDAMENSSGAGPVWWMPPSGIYLVTGTRAATGAARLMRRKGASLWKEIPLRLRLHQTVSSLFQGVDFPESLLKLCNDPAKKKYVEPRRSAVLLYLLWHLLTGKFLDWRETLEESGNAGDITVRVMESFRKRLVQSPGSCKRPFLNEWEEALCKEDPESLSRKTEQDVISEPFEVEDKEGKKGESDSVELSSTEELKDILGAALYNEPIDLDSPDEENIAVDEKSGKQVDLEETENSEPEPEEAVVEEEEQEPQEEEEPEPEEVPEPVECSEVSDEAAEEEDRDDSQPEEVREKPKKRWLPFRIPSFSTDTVPSSRDEAVSPDVETKEPESPRPEESESDDTKPRGPGSSVLSLWIGAAMLGVIGAVAFGSVVQSRAGNAGLFPADTEPFPLTGYIARLNRVQPFEEIDSTAPYSGSFTETDHAIRFEEIDRSVVDAPLQKAHKALEERHFADAVNFSLFALNQSKDDRELARELLNESLRAWTETLSSSGPGSVGFDPLLSQYFLRKNRAEGLRKLTEFAVNGKNEEAMRVLGLLFLQGSLLPQDEKSGVNWLKKAAEAGDRDAGFLFAEGILSGQFADYGDGKSAAIGLLRVAAAAGHSLSQELLAVSLLDGTVGEADQTKAFEWLMSSAEKGNPGAVYHLGLCHANGAGTGRSLEDAAKDFQKAAELGDIRAMYQYGRCLAAGMGIPSSWPLACRWIKKSAMAGHPPARVWCQKRRLEF